MERGLRQVPSVAWRKLAEGMLTSGCNNQLRELQVTPGHVQLSHPHATTPCQLQTRKLLKAGFYPLILKTNTDDCREVTQGALRKS